MSLQAQFSFLSYLVELPANSQHSGNKHNAFDGFKEKCNVWRVYFGEMKLSTSLPQRE